MVTVRFYSAEKGLWTVINASMKQGKSQNRRTCDYVELSRFYLFWHKVDRWIEELKSYLYANDIMSTAQTNTFESQTLQQCYVPLNRTVLFMPDFWVHGTIKRWETLRRKRHNCIQLRTELTTPMVCPCPIISMTLNDDGKSCEKTRYLLAKEGRKSYNVAMATAIEISYIKLKTCCSTAILIVSHILSWTEERW